MKEKIILYNRIKELEKDIEMYIRLLMKYPANRTYRKALQEAKDFKHLAEALYFETDTLQ